MRSVHPRITIGARASIAWLCAAACSEPGDIAATNDHGASIVVSAVMAGVTYPAAPDESRYETGATLGAVTDDLGAPLGALPTGLVTIAGTEVVRVDVFAAADTEPVTTGAILAVARRLDGSVLVSAANGIFHSFHGRLVLSPLTDALATATSLAVAPDGGSDDGEAVVAIVDGALLRVTADVRERIAIPGAAGPATHAAATGEVLLVAYGAALFELGTAGWTYREVPAAIGVVDTMLGSDATGQLVAAGADGLLVRDRDGYYRRYNDLGGVTALALDGAGIVYAQGPGGVVRVDPSGPTGMAPAPTGSAASVGLALDRDGHTWLAQGSELVRLGTGRFVSFATDIAPILEAHCASCHGDGASAPWRDFENYDLAFAMADAIFTRVSTGLMPPKPEPALTAAEYDLLVRWYAGDRAP